MTWWPWRRKRRVRMHLVDAPGVSLPSVEGILVGRGGGEYRIAVPQLIIAPGADPAVLASRYVVIPKSRVAFYEVLS